MQHLEVSGAVGYIFRETVAKALLSLEYFVYKRQPWGCFYNLCLLVNWISRLIV